MKDKTPHDLFREIAEKTYQESGVRIQQVLFDWFNPGIGAGEGSCCIIETRIDSVKSR